MRRACVTLHSRAAGCDESRTQEPQKEEGTNDLRWVGLRALLAEEICHSAEQKAQVPAS